MFPKGNQHSEEIANEAVTRCADVTGEELRESPRDEKRALHSTALEKSMQGGSEIFPESASSTGGSDDIHISDQAGSREEYRIGNDEQSRAGEDKQSSPDIQAIARQNADTGSEENTVLPDREDMLPLVITDIMLMTFKEGDEVGRTASAYLLYPRQQCLASPNLRMLEVSTIFSRLV